MTGYSMEPRMTKYIKGYGFLIARNFSNKYIKQLLDTGQDVLKSISRKVVYNAAEATDEFIGKKNTNCENKTSNWPKFKNVEEITIPAEKIEAILNKLRQVLSKWNTLKYLRY